MDQIKIGRFIAQRRKLAQLTQMQLAEKLSITDRAVSKWETGRALPDSSLMLPLCDILGISVNDLLCGEVVSVEKYNKELESNLIEMTRQKEQADKRLLNIGSVMAAVCFISLATAIVIALAVPMDGWVKSFIVAAGALPLLLSTPFMLKIDPTAGYYQCTHCGHRFTPEVKAFSTSVHAGRKRYAACPNCHKKSWQLKVLSKE